MYFSDVFNVDETLIEEYGAFNISLINDLPLFVDPFLLFNSENKKYKELHNCIIDYLIFLRDKAGCNPLADKGILGAWYKFPEVKQTWLGYSQSGNSGRGLGNDFAISLHKSLKDIFSEFGKEQISKGTHLEKLCLIKSGVGKDCISDFVANLIKGYLAKYTEEFAKQNIDKKLLRKCRVDKTEFNYATGTWCSKEYDLPFFINDYILLTPTDILRYDDTWINRKDFINGFERLIPTIENTVLRAQINDYFYGFLVRGKDEPEPTKKEMMKAAEYTIREFPQIVDVFILNKENNGDEAVSIGKSETELIKAIFVKNVPDLAKLLDATEFYNLRPSVYEDALARVKHIKHVIENQDGYRFFYHNGKPIGNETDLHIMFKLACYKSQNDINSEVNNGRGAVDFVFSYGSQEKELVEFKLARNKKLKKNIEKQIAIYEAANGTTDSITAILCFTEQEQEKVRLILQELKQENNKNIIMIDARNDNKPSASIA